MLTPEQWDSLNPWLDRIEALERVNHNTQAILVNTQERVRDLEVRLAEAEGRLDVQGTKMYWKQDLS